MRKVSHKDVPLVSSLESADSLNDLFVPNDLADDGSNPMSLEISSDDGGLDKSQVWSAKLEGGIAWGSLALLV
uniref:Uncharacterized protein n=1 Tax=Triticum urartu TaxID=4572 RepID=A0A8R7QUL9_TRIUA